MASAMRSTRKTHEKYAESMRSIAPAAAASVAVTDAGRGPSLGTHARHPGRVAGEQARRCADADTDAALTIATKRTARQRFVVMDGTSTVSPSEVVGCCAARGRAAPRDGQVACQCASARCAPVSGCVMCADAGDRAVCPSPRARRWPNPWTKGRALQAPRRWPGDSHGAGYVLDVGEQNVRRARFYRPSALRRDLITECVKQAVRRRNVAASDRLTGLVQLGAQAGRQLRVDATLRDEQVDRRREAVDRR